MNDRVQNMRVQRLNFLQDLEVSFETGTEGVCDKDFLLTNLILLL